MKTGWRFVSGISLLIVAQACMAQSSAPSSDGKSRAEVKQDLRKSEKAHGPVQINDEDTYPGNQTFTTHSKGKHGPKTKVQKTVPDATPAASATH